VARALLRASPGADGVAAATLDRSWGATLPEVEPPRAATLPVVNAATDELVRRAQTGERTAFSELFRRHRVDVARLVYRMLGPSPDAEDVIQEVFLQVHRSLGEFRGQAKFTTWLHRVTVNVVLMFRRAAKSRPVFAPEPVSEREPDKRLLPDEDAARRLRVAAFQRLLDRLPEKKRTVFLLHEIEGLAYAEIAEIVDAPVLTVRTRLFYARRDLAAMLRDEPTLVAIADELGASAPADERATIRTEAT
jgi:RNA polymerase sigma-70 factor (ECF subfamily)